MKFIFAIAILTAGLAAAADQKPQIDAEALKPILSHAWSEQMCDGPDAYVYLHDWVIDTDGAPYERYGGSYTPLSELSFKDGLLTQKDEVGIGNTVSTYKLQADGTLRPWSRVETEEDASTPAQWIKDGQILIGDDGEPLKPSVETVAMKACPQRTQMFPADAVAALGGTWAEVKGGACGKDEGSIKLDFARPIPAFHVGPTKDQAAGDSWILAVSHVEKNWEITAGSAMEASMYRFTPNADGTLAMTTDADNATAVTYKKCPS